MSTSPRLYFVARTDLSEGKRTAQAIHAMDCWAARFGPHLGTVIVYSAADEEELLKLLPTGGRTILWREPDMNDQATAFATDQGPLDIPLLGRKHVKRTTGLEAVA